MINKQEKGPQKLKKGTGLILVVDDEPIMRKIAMNALEKSGYDVMDSEDGDKAIEIFKEYHQNIRAVLLDWLMPKKSGKETFQEMKAIQPDVKAIVITGIKKEKCLQEIMELGIKGYIEKPYTYPQLSNEVYKVLKKPQTKKNLGKPKRD